MRRKKFKTILTSFLIISVFVLAGFAFANFGNRLDSDSQTSQTETSESVNGSFNSGNNDESKLNFYINEATVKKTKTTINETTMFTLEAKMFITNNGSKTELVDVDEFSASYDTEGTGLLYSVEYENVESPVEIDAAERISITFVIKYVITDVENFNDYKKHELKFNYADEPILVCQV